MNLINRRPNEFSVETTGPEDRYVYGAHDLPVAPPMVLSTCGAQFLHLTTRVARIQQYRIDEASDYDGLPYRFDAGDVIVLDHNHLA